MKLFSSIKKLVRSPFGLGLAVLLLAILAYGIHIPWMGFYWDDWPWVWFSHVKGPAGMRLIDIEHRPVTGWVLYLGTLLSGEQPLGWQIYNLAFRVLGCFSLAWMLKALWPGEKERIDWVVLLFLVYPGFGQQFVAVNNSRHLFPLATFFLSLGLMIQAQRYPARSRALTAASLAFSLLTMLTTEYYYGLEWIRLLLLWLITPRQVAGLRDRFLTVLKAWLPYLLPLALIFGWRYTVSKTANYQITLFESFSAAPGQGLVTFLQAALRDLAEAGLGVWAKLFHFPDPVTYGSRARLNFWGLVILAAAGALVYFGSQSPRATRKKWALEAILLGAALLIIAPIPFWVTGLDIKANFPFDRLTLPMMIGSSLLLVGLLEFSLRWKLVRWVVLSALIGLAVGTHYQNGVTYRRDWSHQTTFFQHLVWRIPGLQADTALLANELPTTYSTDNSLTAPLNWTYNPGFSEGNLTAYLFYVDLRFGDKDRALSPGTLTTHDYRFYPFSGSPQQALVIYNQPPGCTRVLSAGLHQHFPGLPANL
ncbi:MAG: hypothetical protein MUO62_02160, partial [Anaerolineales bacterium]|nr:hypothetical protein [Anaerolineales bacterium]